MSELKVLSIQLMISSHYFTKDCFIPELFPFTENILLKNDVHLKKSFAFLVISLCVFVFVLVF